MRLKDIYNNNKDNKLPIISYEVFPPKTEVELKEKLLSTLVSLGKFNPSFVSLTCSAGGTKDNESLATLKFLKENLKFDIMPHVTCVCNSKEEISKRLSIIKDLHIENVLALRGDEPEDISVCHRDFKYANELVRFVKATTDFSIGVAGYPEGHIASFDLQSDIKNLKKKVDEGAEVIFTQLFFDNDKFYRYVEEVRKNGINLPIIAGIMPIISEKQILRMTNLARITIPQELKNNIEKYKNSSHDMKEMGIDYTSRACEELILNNVEGLHFYTLNRCYSTSHILENIL